MGTLIDNLRVAAYYRPSHAGIVALPTRASLLWRWTLKMVPRSMNIERVVWKSIAEIFVIPVAANNKPALVFIGPEYELLVYDFPPVEGTVRVYVLGLLCIIGVLVWIKVESFHSM